MELVKLENDLIEIISNGVNKIKSAELKNDNSLVTNCDIQIEKEIILYLKSNFKGINVISEENTLSHDTSYILKNRFAIVDPIDGTENFYFLDNIYGSAISVIYDNLKYHLIFIPSENKKISTLSIKPNIINNSKIKLFSTSCLNQIKHNYDKQSCRIFGSSTYMFYSLLSGNAKSYEYCDGAKIWDYYTGLSLALNTFLDLTVKLDGNYITEIPEKVNHKSNFEIINNGAK